MIKRQELSTLSDDEDEDNDQSISGIQAILSSNQFSSPTSQLYLKNPKIYFDIIQDPIVIQLLEIHNSNLYYSINCTYLWRLLKFKLKDFKTASKTQQLSETPKLFPIKNDLRVIQYSLKAAEVMSLNEGKEKVVEPGKAPLRQNLKDHVWSMRRNALKKKRLMENELQESIFFWKYVPNKMKLSNSQMEQLKENLLDIQITPLLKKYLGSVLSFIKDALSQVSFREQEDDQQERSILKIILLYTYLKIYLTFTDWLNTISSQKNEDVYFNKIAERKGFGIIQRFLDDAPIDVLKKERQRLRRIY